MRLAPVRSLALGLFMLVFGLKTDGYQVVAGFGGACVAVSAIGLLALFHQRRKSTGARSLAGTSLDVRPPRPARD